jgi:hypothetical protein
LDQLEESWNAQADAANNWNELGLDEIIVWAQRQALSRWGHLATPAAPEVKPVAYLKEWRSPDVRRRVDLSAQCEAWLENYHPTITPLFAHPAPPAEGEVGTLVAWLVGQAIRAADADQSKDAGMLTWAAQVIGERVDEDAITPPPEGERRWTEGICGDGAAILFDGAMVPVDEVVRTLNHRCLQPPAEGEVGELVEWLRKNAKEWGDLGEYSEGAKCHRIAALLQQLSASAPAAVPVAVSERLPDLSPSAGDFNTSGLLWWFTPRLGWRLGSRESIDCIPFPTHWLPFHALPFPAPQEAQP